MYVRKEDTMLREDSGKQYSVFEITNTKNGRKHFMVSSSYDENNILSGIRTYVDSKSVGGGAKDLAQDIK